MARLRKLPYREEVLAGAFLSMVRTCRRPDNVKFNLDDIMQHWFGVAFPDEKYETPFSKPELENKIQLIYDGLIEYQQNKLKGVFMARSKTSMSGDGKAKRTYTSKSKASSSKKRKVIEKTGASVDRRVYICELLIQKKYTDEAIVSMSDRKFTTLEGTKQKWVARLRCRLNNGKYSQFKFKGTIERKPTR